MLNENKMREAKLMELEYQAVTPKVQGEISHIAEITAPKNLLLLYFKKLRKETLRLYILYAERYIPISIRECTKAILYPAMEFTK